MKIPVLITQILSMAWPLAFSYLLTFGLFVVNTVFLGHLGVRELAGGALGTMTCNLTGAVIIIGLLSGMDTLSSQAYGAGNYPRVGLLLQRSIVISCTWVIACAIIWWNAESLLILLGQHPEDAKLAKWYAQWFLMAMPAMVGYEATRRFLQCQSIVNPLLIIVSVSVPGHILGCWLLVFKLKLGFIGAPIALAITYWNELGLLLAYIAYFKPHRKDTWTGWSRECWQGWGEYLKLGIPGALMTSMEWGCFEAMALLAGKLGTIYLASHSIVVNLVAIYFMFALGISIATNIRVGQLLGEGQAQDAKWTAYYALMMGFGIGLCFSLLTFLFRAPIVAIFTSDPTVRSVTIAMMAVMCFFPMFDETQGASQGVLKGAGKQTLGTLTNLVGSYVIGLPVAVVSTFVLGWKLRGLWVGMVATMMTIAGLNCILVVRTQWEAESARARATALGTMPAGTKALESAVIVRVPALPALESHVNSGNGLHYEGEGEGGEATTEKDTIKLCQWTEDGVIPMA